MSLNWGVEEDKLLVFLLAVPLIGIIFALCNLKSVLKIKFGRRVEESDDEIDKAINNEKTSLFTPVAPAYRTLPVEQSDEDRLLKLSNAVKVGAQAFLTAEYSILAIAVLLFAICVFSLLQATRGVLEASMTTLAFVLGACTSIFSGYIGMTIAVNSNARTTLGCAQGWSQGFFTAFKAGNAIGFILCSVGCLMVVFVTALAYVVIGVNHSEGKTALSSIFEAVTGFGLGGSLVALFARVGGGIYTKAADVGADLVGKLEKGLPEDDERNAAVIADNVGDNVGDVSGMSADLFGSFAESTVACFIISSTSIQAGNSWLIMSFPLVVSVGGVLASMLASFLTMLFFRKLRDADGVGNALKTCLVMSSVLVIPVHVIAAFICIPSDGILFDNATTVKPWDAVICLVAGVVCGCVIGLHTEYYTSARYKPTRALADASTTGAATNVISGLSLGYASVVVPVICIAVCLALAFHFGDTYGLGLGAIGILSNLCITLSIDAFGPIADNSGGLCEMAHFGEYVRERTDALDSAGNTTAAIGKGGAIASASLVSLALLGAFVNQCRQHGQLLALNVMDPMTFAGLLIGAMLPYSFSGYTVSSVGKAALAMVQEVRRQFREIPGIMDGTGVPEYDKCVSISTKASLKEMIAPGLLVLLTPIIVGVFFGVGGLAGLLAGSIVSGIQMAVSASNSGGSWDNAKKFIEGGNLGNAHSKGSSTHLSAVVGDTVGDPLKDTSGPSLNILMKLMAVESLVLCSVYLNIEGGRGLIAKLG